MSFCAVSGIVEADRRGRCAGWKDELERPMSKDSHAHRELHALCRMAGERANGDGPIARLLTDEGSSSGSRKSAKDWKAVFAVALCALAAAAVAAQLLDAPATVVAPLPEPAIDAVLDESSTLPAPLADTPDAAVRWQAGELKVDLESQPLDQAIGQLAQATHSSVSGQQLLRGGERVTMHWHARDVATAWQLMLHDRAAYSVRCESSACQVRITGQLSASTAAGPSSPVPASNAPAAAGPASDEQSQPDGAC
jgi:hypothetical protein